MTNRRQLTRYGIHSIAVIAWLVLMNASAPVRGEVVAGLTQVTLNDNGAWSWYEDERAIINQGKLIVGSVADSSGTDGTARNGNIEVATYDFATAAVSRFVLHAHLSADDHNSPALHVRPDGRILAVYSKHGGDNLTRWRVTDNPGDASSWQLEETRNNGAATTYSNVYRLASEDGGNGRTYNFTRTLGWDPNFLVSSDEGDSWSYGGRLLDAPGRPYLKYASNGVDTIHFITTEQHPRDFNNSIYHGYIEGGQVFKSDGTLVAALDATGESPTDFTQVFAGDANNVAWTTDLQLDSSGYPYMAFSVQKDKNDQDHRYYYGRWDGTEWQVNQMAFAGSRLYSPENDYTGLVALKPDDPNTVYISADVDPLTGSPLISDADGQRHYEIFEGITANDGVSWSWSPITEDSTQDNIRPIVPVPDGENSALLWLSGTYSTYTNFDLDVVGVFTPSVEPPLFGDLNFDKAVDELDYLMYVDGLHRDLSGLTAKQAYQKGDMNSDFFNNYVDVLLFRDAYNDFNGQGAFEALFVVVPEPDCLALVLIGGVLLPLVRSKKRDWHLALRQDDRPSGRRLYVG